jgi:hypothetical protein
MRFEEGNDNMRSQIQNLVAYTYVAGREVAVPRKKKSEKQNLNVRTGMRKSGSTRCGRLFDR